ncbi:MAG: HNH endonuclease signature motif containing protein [Caldilineales bacterium]
MNQRYPEIALRALHVCEYCRAPEAVFNLAFEVEHIVPLSRGGSDETDNLALACRSCNLYKSTAIQGKDTESGQVAPLFTRADRWDEHFRIDRGSAQIVGITAIGRATIECLNMNGELQLTALRHGYDWA